MEYIRIDTNSPFGIFIVDIFKKNQDNPFVNATDKYPNIVPSFDNFNVTDESKTILKNYNEMNIINKDIVLDNIALPFNPDKDDIFAVFDTYTINDSSNYRSKINFNYFYNPTITNFMKMCRILQYIMNDKIIITEKYIFIENIIADMLRRIRFIEKIDNGVVYTKCLIFDMSAPIIDSIITEDDFNNIITVYGNELYDCDTNKIDFVYSDISGDADDVSQIGNKLRYNEENNIDNMDEIDESDEFEDFDNIYDYEYTYAPDEIDDALILQSFWTFCRSNSNIRRLKKTREFNKWRRIMNAGDLSPNEFIVKLLRNEIPLNVEVNNNNDGIYIFNDLDIIKLSDTEDAFENSEDIIRDYNASYGENIVFDDNMPYEYAYPDVFEWIKHILNIE